MQTTRQCRTKTVVRCQKKRLACFVLDDGTCADLLSFVVVTVRWLVVEAAFTRIFAVRKQLRLACCDAGLVRRAVKAL